MKQQHQVIVNGVEEDEAGSSKGTVGKKSSSAGKNEDHMFVNMASLVSLCSFIVITASAAGIYYTAFQQQQPNQNIIIVNDNTFNDENNLVDKNFARTTTSTRFLMEENIHTNTSSYDDDYDEFLLESSSSVDDGEDVFSVPEALLDEKEVHSNIESHDPLFPLTSSDYFGFLLAVIGLLIAAGGGIGGGGMLVPIYMLVMRFPPKQAIPLSNVTIVGGAIANTMLNITKRHPLADRPLIDYDITLVMIPLTLLGALIGAFLNKILPDLLLTVLLVLLLSFTSWATLKKAVSMHQKETRDMSALRPSELIQLTDHNTEIGNNGANTNNNINYDSVTGAQDIPVKNYVLEKIVEEERHIPICNLMLLIGTFAVVLAVNLLKGGGGFKSPLGIQCGSNSFWLVNLFLVVWIVALAIYIRHYLVTRHRQKIACGYQFVDGDIKWCEKATIFYPLICCFAGFFAGMFGIGGGIITGPLILAMGVHPQVNQACNAFMILFSALTATTSFIVFGFLIPDYAVVCFAVGFVATLVGHIGLEHVMKKSNRNSYIAFSIGFVVLISACLLSFESVSAVLSGEHHHSTGICSKS